jgi:TatD DNase family protein
MERRPRSRLAGDGPPVNTATFVDTHVHFDSCAPEALRGVLERAGAAGVVRMIAIGGTPEANRFAVNLAHEHPGRIRAAVGYDRDQAVLHPSLEECSSLLADPSVAGVGEIGLDYYYSADTADQQKSLFAQMLELARRFRKPVVVHSRSADDDTLILLAQHAREWTGEPGRIGVLHCFTGSLPFAQKVVDLGFLIGFSGILTFKSAEALRAVARWVPADRLLAETDSPYLAPVPYRGKTNEPSFVPEVYKSLAAVRGEPVETLAARMVENASRLFGKE